MVMTDVTLKFLCKAATQFYPVGNSTPTSSWFMMPASILFIVQELFPGTSNFVQTGHKRCLSSLVCDISKKILNIDDGTTPSDAADETAVSHVGTPMDIVDDLMAAIFPQPAHQL